MHSSEDDKKPSRPQRQGERQRRIPPDFDFDERYEIIPEIFIVHAGSIREHKVSYEVHLLKKSKNFNFKKCGSKEDALLAAEEHREVESDYNGCSFLTHKTKRICNQCEAVFTPTTLKFSKCENCDTRHRFRSCLMLMYFEGKQCINCGESNPIFLETDIDDVKKYTDKNGKKQKVRQVPLNLLKEELAKCEILCVMCHRLKRTKNRKAADQLCGQRYINEIKARLGSCTLCGFSDPLHLFLFDFDHKFGDKTCEISKMKKRSHADIDAEIAKTQFLCCKCHRLKTAKEDNYKMLSDFTEAEIAKARTFLAE